MAICMAGRSGRATRLVAPNSPSETVKANTAPTSTNSELNTRRNRDTRVQSKQISGGDEMSQVIQVSLDNRGHLLIPAALRRQLGLSPGMTLAVEETANRDVRLRIRSEVRETPALVDKGGVLVVRAEPLGDLTDVVRQEHDRRVSWTRCHRIRGTD